MIGPAVPYSASRLLLEVLSQKPLSRVQIWLLLKRHHGLSIRDMMALLDRHVRAGHIVERGPLLYAAAIKAVRRTTAW